MRIRLRRAAVGATTVLSAVVLSGCYSAFEESAVQQDVIGAVTSELVYCPTPRGVPVEGGLDRGAAGQPVRPTCGTVLDRSASRGQATVDITAGYELPEGTIGPPQLRDEERDLTLVPNDRVTAYLTANHPPAAGRRWVGYRSTTSVPEYEIDADGNLRSIVTSGLITLRSATDGSPFDGPLTYRWTGGYDEPGLPEAEQCPATATGVGGARRRAYLADRGLVAGEPGVGTCAPQIGTASLVTRDLGIVPLSAATVQAGGTAPVTFAVKFDGPADDAATFALTATGPEGLTLTPDTTTYAPATDSSKDVVVSATVPATTAPGTYDVTLTASLPNGQQRSGTAKLQVTAPPPPPAAPEQPAPAPLPALVETLDELPAVNLKDLLAGGGLPATVGCNTVCTAGVDLLVYEPPARRVGLVGPDQRAAKLRATVVKTVLVGRDGSSVGPEGGKRTVTFRLSEKTRNALARLGRFTMIVRTTATDVNGQKTPPLVRKIRFAPGCGAAAKPCVPR